MNKIRILLVEDDEEMCEELVPILEDSGRHVDVTHDGQSAIVALEKVRYALMLLDLKMPGINGYEVLQYAHKLHPAVKILVLSGSPLYRELKEEEQIFPGEEEFGEYIKKFAHGFLTKPFVVEEVLQKIKELLGKQESA